jgi:hypothetical protein
MEVVDDEGYRYRKKDVFGALVAFRKKRTGKGQKAVFVSSVQKICDDLYCTPDGWQRGLHGGIRIKNNVCEKTVRLRAVCVAIGPSQVLRLKTRTKSPIFANFFSKKRLKRACFQNTMS